MPGYLLDTDTVSLLQEGNRTVVARVAAASAVSLVGICPVTIDEQVSGRLAQVRAATTPDEIAAAYRWLATTVIFLGQLPVLPYDAAAVGVCAALGRMKLNVKKNDLRIAATALVAGAVVVTRNRRDFGRVPGLVVEDWSIPP